MATNIVKYLKQLVISDTNTDQSEQNDPDEDEMKTTSTSSSQPYITTELITPPKPFAEKLAFVLHDVYSKEECAQLIVDSKKIGYEKALVNIGGGRQKLMERVRNGSRCIWDNNDKAEELWARIKPFIPQEISGRTALGLNERLRILRYEKGQHFSPHMDGRYVRENGERSYITVLLYLNEGYTGGRTTFLSWNEAERVEVEPRTGSMLVFHHYIQHEGARLIDGIKYCMRTDVMYSPK